METMKRTSSWLKIVGACVSVFCAACGPSYAQEKVQIANGGSAQLQIVTGPNALSDVTADAQTLASKLQAITGAQFDVQTGDGSSGIAVGTTTDFNLPDLNFNPDPNDPMQGDQYVLRSHPGGIWVIGASPIGVEHGVWDLLYRIGYRQFFPAPEWEVIPSISNLSLSVNAVEKPSFTSRMLAYTYGTWDYSAPTFKDWCAKNRMDNAFIDNSKEVWNEIILRNKQQFAAHPEFMQKERGRATNKFAVSNPDLRNLVVQDAIALIKQHPNMHCVSVEPSDGPGWGDDPTGSPSDRVVTLANQVADAIRQKYGNGYYVAFDAYYQHSPPPNIQIHPGVIVNVATGFNESGMPVPQLIQAWAAKGAMVGIYEYYSIPETHRDLPKIPRSSSTPYITSSLHSFYESGARFLIGQNSDDWGASGWGYYLVSRILWNHNYDHHADEVKQDFLDKAFGSAAGPMGKFYADIDGNFTGNTLPSPHVTPAQIALMYNDLANAESATSDSGAIARIDDLVIFTRYCELMAALIASPKGPSRDEAGEALMRFCYATRKSEMVNVKALYEQMTAGHLGVNVPSDAKWNVPESSNPWKQDPAPTHDQILGYLGRYARR